MGLRILPVYGQVYLDADQEVQSNTDVIFNNFGVLKGIIFEPPSSDIFLPIKGDYAIDFQVNTDQSDDLASAFAIAVNDTIVSTSRYGERSAIDVGNTQFIHLIPGSTIITVPDEGATVSLRNITLSDDDLRSSVFGEGATPVIAASIRIFKLS